MIFVCLVCVAFTCCVNQSVTESVERGFRTETPLCLCLHPSVSNKYEQRGDSTRAYKDLDRRDVHTLKLNIQHTARMFLFLLFIDMSVMI